MAKIMTENTPLPVCPHCGETTSITCVEIIADQLEYEDTCQHCTREYKILVTCEITYTTSKVENNDDENED